MHLFRYHFYMVCEIQVTWIIQRHQMNMRMRHIDTHHSDTHFDAGTDFLQTLGHHAAESVQCDKKIIVQIEDIVYLLLGDTEHMALHHRVDIQKRQTLVGLSNFVAGDLACNNT